MLPWKEFQSRLPTLDELHQWFATPQNLAIITGAISGVVVVDVDDRHARQWWMRHRPYTPWQTKTASGNHFSYQHPGCGIRNRARLETPDGTLAIDVRGDGGYVVAPGSSMRPASRIARPAIGEQRVARSPSLAELDRAATRRRNLLQGIQRRRNFCRNSTVDTHIRARAYLAAIPRPEIGARE